MITTFLNNCWMAFWLFLPAGIANMTPSIANKIPVLNRWNTPLDFGKSFRGQRILGDNKRWRGVVLGTIMAGIVAALLYGYWAQQYQLRVSSMPVDWIMFGLLLGFGALIGDAIESFLKRRAGIKPGHTWFPFDQIDYIVGGLLLTYPFVKYTGSQIVFIFIVYFGLHLVVNYIGYLMKFKDSPI